MKTYINDSFIVINCIKDIGIDFILKIEELYGTQ